MDAATLRALLRGLALLLASVAAMAQDAAYTVKPGDILLVSVWKEPDLQGQALVMPDGTFAFPLIGQVDARGKSVAELQKTVSERLAKYMADPVVTVSVQEIRGNKIYVIGQVNHPGEFVASRRLDVIQALAMAGGTTAFASLNDIVVIRKTGATQQLLPFRYTEVVRGKNLEQNFDLQAGDTVVVP